MWEPRRLTTVWASTASYRNSFAFHDKWGKNFLCTRRKVNKIIHLKIRGIHRDYDDDRNNNIKNYNNGKNNTNVNNATVLHLQTIKTQSVFEVAQR
jgi:hypothetical protein